MKVMFGAGAVLACLAVIAGLDGDSPGVAMGLAAIAFFQGARLLRDGFQRRGHEQER